MSPLSPAGPPYALTKANRAQKPDSGEVLVKTSLLSMEFLIAITVLIGKPRSASISRPIQDQQSRLEHTPSHL